MIVSDVATNFLDTELLPQYNTTELNSGITFIVFFSVSRSLFAERKYTHTNTHTYTQGYYLWKEMTMIMTIITTIILKRC